jgi:hypothetical protein
MKVGIIVDGEGDMAAINAKFQSQFKVLKTDGPRGHSAPIDKIIANGRKQISMLKAFQCDKIILMLDLESRSYSCDHFISGLSNELEKFDFGVPIVFAVPDRMIENWFLADIEHLSKKKTYLRDNIKQKNFEGTYGKNEIKKLFKKEYSYSEVTHGPQLFLLIRDAVASENSPSYKRFLLETGVMKPKKSSKSLTII